jgi:integrase
LDRNGLSVSTETACRFEPKSPVGNSEICNFAIICQRIGLRPAQQYGRHGCGPRIHDLRHSFAARTILDWYRTGKDPAREMIRLTTYLGHTNPENTYWYIEAVPELLELASHRATDGRDGEAGR